MDRPIPLPARAVLAGLRIANQLRIMSGPDDAHGHSVEARFGRKHPKLLAGRTDLSIDTVDLSVPGQGGSIPVRVYSRPDIEPSTAGLLFIHGGGFIDCGLDFTDNVQRGLASRTGCVVVGLSYRLAPEWPFPAALNDCQAVLRWMVESRPHGMDPTRLAIAGESAGGNLATAVVLANRDGDRLPILHQTCVYPFTDMTLGSTDWGYKMPAWPDAG